MDYYKLDTKRMVDMIKKLEKANAVLAKKTGDLKKELDKCKDELKDATEKIDTDFFKVASLEMERNRLKEAIVMLSLKNLNIDNA